MVTSWALNHHIKPVHFCINITVGQSEPKTQWKEL